MYTLFITFAAVLGAPLLYSISLYFVEVMGSLLAKTTATAPTAFAGGGFGGFAAGTGGIQITPDQLLYFSIASIIITNIFGSLLMGLIQHGQEKRGVKFIPVFLTGSLGVFFLARFVIQSLLGSLFIR